MKKTLFLTSFVALTFVVPAMAVPSNTSSTFPANGKMLEDYTYQNQATVTNLKVSEGTATTTAQYDNCPAEYPNSDEGAESTDECYTACTVSDFPAGSHIASVTGKNYSGANVTDTCAIASCDTGYHLQTNTLADVVGTQVAPSWVDINHSGTYENGAGSTTQQTYGISAADTFGVDYGSGKGRITGKALCSTQQGTKNPYTTFTTMTPEFGVEEATYCYCQLDSYTPDGGTKQTLVTPWMFVDDFHSVTNCSKFCASNCANTLHLANDNFRVAVLGSVSMGAPSCDANTIQITWADADAEDIAANDAGSVTYGGDIRTPKKAVHKPGKIFTGWTFNTPSGN